MGPFKSIEESAIFTLVTENVVDILSWYGTAEFSSAAIGLAVSGAIMTHLQNRDWDFVTSCRAIFILYAAIGVFKILLSSCLSSRIEAWHDLTPKEQQQQAEAEDDGHEVEPEQEASTQPSRDSPSATASDPELAPLLQSNLPPVADSQATETVATTRSNRFSIRQTLSRGLLNSVFTLHHKERILLLKLCLLMGTDSTAVGMSSVPWQTYYVRTHFSVSDGSLGLIFFTANLLGACGTISSNFLARRMGNLVVCRLQYDCVLEASNAFS